MATFGHTVGKEFRRYGGKHILTIRLGTAHPNREIFGKILGNIMGFSGIIREFREEFGNWDIHGKIGKILGLLGRSWESTKSGRF